MFSIASVRLLSASDVGGSIPGTQEVHRALAPRQWMNLSVFCLLFSEGGASLCVRFASVRALGI